MDSGKLEELGFDMIIGRDLLQALKVICRGSSSDTTANKINPYYLIG